MSGPQRTRLQPPAKVRDWLHSPDRHGIHVPLDFLGIHTDHGLGGPTPVPGYPYDAVRSHDADDGTQRPVLQWANIEVKPGVYDWTAFDRWIAANPSKTRIFVVCGCPKFYQKYPGEPWPYPDLPGGGSPPRDPAVLGAFVRRLVARHPGKIHFVEAWNEPSFGWGVAARLTGRWTPAMEKPGFFTGTAEDLAGMMRVIRRALPPGARLMAGAWEGHSEGTTMANGLLRVAAASDGAGGHGRDHVQALSVHSYTYKSNPNKMIKELRDYKARFRQAGYRSSLPMYVSEIGAESPQHWTATFPATPVKVRMIKRWCLIPAALGFQGVYLYKHSIMKTLGDPAGEPSLARAIGMMRNGLRGRRLEQAALLEDDSIWLAFADGSQLRA